MWFECKAARYGLRSMMGPVRAISPRYFACAVFCAVLLLSASVRSFLPSVFAQKWEPSISEFEKADKANPPKPGVIVFAGSSSFRYWDTLGADMKPLDVINRGFGGSEFSDLNQYAKRIVIVYRPRAVVVYEGDNDLAEGSPKTPQIVADDFRQFVQIVHSELPETWIYILSIKPSRLRWNDWPKMKTANQLIQSYAAMQDRVQYIDVATPMFDASGGLPGDLFKSDGLHPTPKLYAMWASIIRPVLLQRFGTSKKAARNMTTTPNPGFLRFSPFSAQTSQAGLAFYPASAADLTIRSQM
jgi:lysophospholipase L1-like esterase